MLSPRGGMMAGWEYGAHSFRTYCEDARGRPASAHIAASDGLSALRRCGGDARNDQ